MSMEYTLAVYPDDRTQIAINGMQPALTQSVKERVITEKRPVYGFGDPEPCAYVTDKTVYELELTHLPGSDLNSFPMSGEFTVLLSKHGTIVRYTRCECVSCESVSEAGEPETEKVTLRALEREYIW